MASNVIGTDEQDQALLSRYRSGDVGAFSSLVLKYQKPVYNAAFRVLGNVDDATDIAQIVFLRVVERIESYDSQYRFFSWLYRIAINEAIDFLRRTSREDELDEDYEYAAPDTANPEHRYAEKELSVCVQAALMKLKTNERIVITLRHFNDCSYSEIAEILTVDEKTVKSRLFEARRRLSGLLKNLS